MRTIQSLVLLAAWMMTLSVYAADPNVQVKRLEGDAIQPRIATGADGTVHLIYFRGDATAGDLYYRKSVDGKSFSEPVRINAQDGAVAVAGGMRPPGLAVSGSGTVHVMWFGSKNAEPRAIGKHSMPLLYARLSAGAAAFEPVRNLRLRTEHLDGGGAIAADAAGNVYAVWHAVPEGQKATEQNRVIVAARSADDGKTFSPEQTIETPVTGACGCCGLAAATSSNGDLHILYRSAETPNDRHMQWVVFKPGDGSVTGRTVSEWKIPSCPASSCRVLPAGDRMLLAWEGKSSAMGLRVEGSEEVPMLHALSLRTAAAKHPTIATNAAGQTLLVWINVPAFGQPGVLQWQMYSKAGLPITGARGEAADAPTWASPAIISHKEGSFTIVY